MNPFVQLWNWLFPPADPLPMPSVTLDEDALAAPVRKTPSPRPRKKPVAAKKKPKR